LPPNLFFSSNSPCIPYLGVYQTDLTFIEDGNPDFLDNGYINFFKRRLVAEVIRELQIYQHKGYAFSSVESIVHWLSLQEQTNIDEETVYNVSLIIEPREEPKEKGKSQSISRSKSTKIAYGSGNASTESVSKKDKIAKSHQSWNVETVEALNKGIGERNSSSPKLAKFFGVSNVDFTLLQKLNGQSEAPKSILDDVDLNYTPSPSGSGRPYDIVTSPIELTPEQIEQYKKQQLERYELEQRMKLSPLDLNIDPKTSFYEQDSGWI